MNFRQYLLNKLAEECVEVAQRALKQAQFGALEIQKGQLLDNRTRLCGEMNDLLAVAQMLLKTGDLPHQSIDETCNAHNAKRQKIWKYLDLSRALGFVEPAQNPGENEDGFESGWRE